MSDANDRIDGERRRLLARLGLAGGLAYAAPALTVLGAARASGISRSRPSRITRPTRPRVRRQQARPAPAPPPEIVLFLPSGAAIGPAEAAGYRVLATVANQTLAGSVFRLGLPAGRDLAAARTELAALLPGTVSDGNHLYRPDEFLCTREGCAAHEAIGWAGWPSAMAPRIGMIDTGINTGHDAFRGARLTVHQAELDGREAAGRQHGTAIAAMLVGQTASRVPGLLPLAELIAVEAFHRDAAGDAADAYSLVAAMDLLIGEGVDVVNLSFSGPENVLLDTITRRAAEQGIGLVAAAGNGGPGAGPAFPAAWPHVVAVTAVDHRMRVYRQANQGPYVNFAAPGVGVWTAASVSGGRLRSGTSYAAPFVTAVLAVERLRSPGLPLEDAIAALVGCAQDLGEAGHDPVFGHGLVSAPDQCRGPGAALFPVAGE